MRAPRVGLCLAVAGSLGLLLAACQRYQSHAEPTIVFTKVPPMGEGSPQVLEDIEGSVKNAEPGQRIVLYARSGMWWVQPLVTDPFTLIPANGRWKNQTHPGTAYAALLVDSRFRPPPTTSALPAKGGLVLASSTVEGKSPAPLKRLQFSGYVWEIRQAASDPGGTRNFYNPDNAWTDREGLLHLRLTRAGDHWMSAEIRLTRSLGYGTYRFVVRDVAHFEPAVVLALFTWDDFGPSREMDIELSRWGEPEDKNAQFVVQPYVVPANTVRFEVPQGALTYWMRWAPGSARFQANRGVAANLEAKPLFEHVFSSGIPEPGAERVSINLYVYDNNRHPLQHETEAVIERFEFFP
jgi:hypothetical protein